MQKLGWYNHYSLGYLDGGVVPTMTSADGTKLNIQPQSLYYPRSMVIKRSSTFTGRCFTSAFSCGTNGGLRW